MESRELRSGSDPRASRQSQRSVDRNDRITLAVETLPEGICLRVIEPIAMESDQAESLDRVLRRHLAPDSGSMIFDVSQVEFFDSVTTDVLMRLDHTFQSRGEKLVICGVNPLCLEIFQLSGVDCLLTLADDLIQARVLLAKKASGLEVWH